MSEINGAGCTGQLPLLSITVSNAWMHCKAANVNEEACLVTACVIVRDSGTQHSTEQCASMHTFITAHMLSVTRRDVMPRKTCVKL